MPLKGTQQGIQMEGPVYVHMYKVPVRVCICERIYLINNMCSQNTFERSIIYIGGNQRYERSKTNNPGVDWDMLQPQGSC